MISLQGGLYFDQTLRASAIRNGLSTDDLNLVTRRSETNNQLMDLALFRGAKRSGVGARIHQNRSGTVSWLQASTLCIAQTGDNMSLEIFQLERYGLQPLQTVRGMDLYEPINDFRAVGGRLYLGNGSVRDLLNGEQLGVYDVPLWPWRVLPDASVNRVYFLLRSHSRWELHTFEMDTHRLLAVREFHDVDGSDAELFRFDADGLACQIGDRLVVFRDPTGVQQSAAPTLTVQVRPDRARYQAGQRARFVVTVTNTGPTPATDGFATVALPDGATFQRVASSLGATRAIGQVVFARLGSLSPGQSKSFSVDATVATRATDPVKGFVSCAEFSPDREVQTSTTVRVLPGPAPDLDLRLESFAFTGQDKHPDKGVEADCIVTNLGRTAVRGATLDCRLNHEDSPPRSVRLKRVRLPFIGPGQRRMVRITGSTRPYHDPPYSVTADIELVLPPSVKDIDLRNNRDASEPVRWPGS